MVGLVSPEGIGEPPTTQRMAAQGLQGKLFRARYDLDEVRVQPEKKSGS
ncbi:MAG: hypothetical protein VCA35_08730 [Roseibacillus sp.]